MLAGLYNIVSNPQATWQEYCDSWATISRIRGLFSSDTPEFASIKWQAQKRFNVTADTVHATDAYGRSWGIALLLLLLLILLLLLLNFGTRWVLSGLTPRPARFTAEEKDHPPLLKPTEQGVGGSHSRSGRFWRRAKTCCPWPESNPETSRTETQRKNF